MESVLKSAGTCGPYQIIHVLFTQLPRFATVFSFFFMMFGAYDPGWRCKTFVYNNHTTDSNQTPKGSTLNVSLVDAFNFNSNTGKISDERVTYYSRELNRTLILEESLQNGGPYYNESCDVIDSCVSLEFNPSSRTIVTEFQLVCERAWLIRMVLLIQGTGSFLGPLLAGQIGESFGRKLSLYGCTAVIAVSSFIAIFSTHWAMFAVCYFFIAAAGNGIIGIAPVYASEFLNAKWRGYYGSIPTTNIASCLFTVVTLFMKNWVHVHILTLAISLVACTGFFVVTESPRWLVVNGHVQKAEKSIRRIAKVNRKPDLDNKQYFQGCYREVTEQEVVTSSTRGYTLMDTFRNRQTLVFILKFSVINLLFSATYQTVTFGIASLPGEYYINAILAAVTETVVVVMTGPLCNTIGRRFSGALFGVLGFAACLTTVITLTTSEEGDARTTVVKISAFLAKSSGQAISIVVLVFANELFPTAVRNLSIGLLRSVAGIGSLLVPFLLPSKENTSIIICFSVLCVFYVINAVIFTSLPETKDSDLTDRLTRNEKVLEVQIAEDDENTDLRSDDEVNVSSTHSRQ